MTAQESKIEKMKLVELAAPNALARLDSELILLMCP